MDSSPFQADIVVDMATLTGAQGIATGKYHASILTNDDEWEAITVKAGKVSGDLCHPVPFTPELHFSEFSSPVADMQVALFGLSQCTSARICAICACS